MKYNLLDLYTDYLISSFSYATATGLSAAVNGSISHDQVTRFLSGSDFDSPMLWKKIKPLVRSIESDDGVLIFDDTIEEKPYTDESSLITWHFDHTKGRSVKGINILSCLYHGNQEMNIPLGIEPIKKSRVVIDPTTGKERRKSLKTKNEQMRAMLDIVVHRNHVKCAYIVMDVWFAAAETLAYIKQDLQKDFVCPIKSNRLVQIGNQRDRSRGYQQVSSVSLATDIPVWAWIEGLLFPVMLMKHVFKNEDGSEGILYLVCSDKIADGQKIFTVYQKRWHGEEYHKSLKSLVGLAKSPTKTIRTQVNHIFSCVFAYVKLETLQRATHLNHFALKTKLYVSALKTSMEELTKLKALNACYTA